MLHECMSSTMSSRFTLALIVPRVFVCTKISRKFPNTMTCLASFFDITKAWFIYPVGYNVRCRGDCLGYGFVYVDDSASCNTISFKCTKLHEIKEYVEHVLEEIISSNKRGNNRL